MLAVAHIDTSFGWFELKGSELGLQSVRKVDPAMPATDPIPEVLVEAAQQLQEYFRRERTSFDLTLDWGSTPEFNRRVWEELLKIPYGHTTSYSAIAEKLNNPAAVRAVGAANRNNPLAIIVPCHRVIAKDGKLHGYFYGLDMKRALLELENPRSFARQGNLF